ncbi:MAG: hypothetical protein LBG57_05325 [Treponema sp.]|nr:hypothetical protein [Treponema sp.]
MDNAAGVLLPFLVPVYLIVIVIFSRVKKYNFLKLLCGLMLVLLFVAVIVSALIWLFSKGTITTVNGVVSILPLAIFVGLIAGYGISLCLLTGIEKPEWKE